VTSEIQQPELADRSIGAILAGLRHLSADQVERIVRLQRDNGLRFGEAAVQLGFVSSDDVMYALSQQFHFPYAPEEGRTASAELITQNHPFGPQAESFRAIRSQLMMRVFQETRERRALAVISPQHADGKSYFAANLAVVLAQLGGRTLLVDADMRHGRQHEIFGVENRSGLSGILVGRTESKVIQQVAGIPNLFVLPGGNQPPNPLELVERPAFGLLMKELMGKFDHVLVDTPAAASGSDGAVIASRCGAALLIARKDQSRIADLQDLLASLQQTSVAFAGVVYNEF
jgi:protein-tyrosine kinase